MTNAEHSLAGGFPPDYPHRPKSAGVRIGHSTSFLNQHRMKDSRRIAEGQEPEGPVWSVDGKGNIFYFEEDLVEWLREKIRRVTDALPKVQRGTPFNRNLPQSGRAATSNHLSPNDNPPTAA